MDRILFQGGGWDLPDPLSLSRPLEVHETKDVAGLEAMLEWLEGIARSGDPDRLAVGFLTYEAGLALEGSPKLARPGDKTPLARFALYRLSESEPDRDVATTTSLKRRSREGSLDPASWALGVKEIRDAIERGDVYQVNLTRRIRIPGAVDPFRLARLLAADNPVPFGLCLEGDYFSVVSNSPELLVDADLSRGTIESRPIKGTIARGTSSEDDRRAREALMASPKDAAEHVMIVDLVRNDLGKCSIPGSVSVAHLARLLSFRHLHHLESTVRGRLRSDVRLPEVFHALLPAGSVTGAPKRAALRIIHALEPSPRGPYTGAVGYVRGNGRLVFNVPIRTAILSASGIDYHTGGGIVWDSDPSLEWEETETKAREFEVALIALGGQREVPN